MPTRTIFHLVVVLATMVVVGMTAHWPGQENLLAMVAEEDGPVEWATVASLLLISFACAGWAAGAVGLRRVVLLSTALLTFVAAGEEISWGQRLLGIEPGEFMLSHNYQNENNLHNLIPAPVFNGLVLLCVWVVFVLLPLLARLLRWRNDWMAAPAISVMFLCAIAVNHYELINRVEMTGAILILATLLAYSWLAIKGDAELRLQVALVWILGVFLYLHRDVLELHNMQYEIREWIYIYAFGFWAIECLKPMATPASSR